MPIVYLDESGFSHDMPRRRGYSLKGKKCYGSCDWHAKGRTNVIGALIGKKLLTADPFDTNINADIYKGWIAEKLLPKLSEKSVLSSDNAKIHKRRDIIELIENAGHILEWLPKYSPQLNPIEKKWAQLKAWRKKLFCSVEELLKIESFYLR